MNIAKHSHITYCLENGAMDQSDVDRLLGILVHQPRVQSIAQEFNASVDDMALSALDAGIAFLRARILTIDVDIFFSPAPLADEGWDVMSDNPGERTFYITLCQRLCELAGVTLVVPEHYRFSEVERLMARDFNAVGNVIAAMDRLNLAYVPEHWPTGGGGCGGTSGLACGFRPLGTEAAL